MAKWAKAHGPRKGEVFANVELWKNLPAFWAKELLHGE